MAGHVSSKKVSGSFNWINDTLPTPVALKTSVRTDSYEAHPTHASVRDPVMHIAVICGLQLRSPELEFCRITRGVACHSMQTRPSMLYAGPSGSRWKVSPRRGAQVLFNSSVNDAATTNMVGGLTLCLRDELAPPTLQQ